MKPKTIPATRLNCLKPTSISCAIRTASWRRWPTKPTGPTWGLRLLVATARTSVRRDLRHSARFSRFLMGAALMDGVHSCSVVWIAHE